MLISGSIFLHRQLLTVAHSDLMSARAVSEKESDDGGGGGGARSFDNRFYVEIVIQGPIVYK